MTSIWGFLIQTVEVSLVAIILLLMKRIFVDKLSPRWQYGIWSLLALSIVIPAGYFGNYILPVLNIFIETIKTMIEQGLHSHFINSFEIIHNFMFLPWIIGRPTSITDMIFMIYVIGIVVCFIHYCVCYWNLKKIIKRGIQASDSIYHQVEKICQHYHLKSCQNIIVLENLPSPFVFGIFHPVLVLPNQSHIDDKIILHELLHLKYKDILQNIGWSLLKSLHWCNPFLNYVFHTIHNDMESLCDQRVLELVEGEERRDYGRILLSMTNDQYPSTFGTSSISNGGKNIKKRIENIVRFKQYPKGMFLVSICIGILLLPMVITGTSTSAYIETYDDNLLSFEYQLSISSAKLIQCRTMASAIDLYAKGILKSNDLYLISVMPQQQQKNYVNVLRNKPTNIYSSNQEALYKVINLEKINNQTYKAYLLFETNEEEYDENDEIEAQYTRYAIIPIQITKEQGWKVQQIDEIIRGRDEIQTYYSIKNNSLLPVYKHLTQKVKTGIIDVDVYKIQTVNNQVESNNDIFNSGASSFSLEPNFDAEFDEGYQLLQVKYQTKSTELNNIGVYVGNLYDMKDNCKYEKDIIPEWGMNTGGYSNEESYSFQNINNLDNHTLNLAHYTEGKINNRLLTSYQELPKGYQIDIWENKKKVDSIHMEVGGEIYE